MTNKKTIRILFEKHLQGTITPSEMDTLLAYAADAQDSDTELDRQIRAQLERDESGVDLAKIDEVVNKIEHRLLTEITSVNGRKGEEGGRVRRLTTGWTAAAIALFAVAFSLYFWMQGNQVTDEAAEVAAIAPGGTRAMLTIGGKQTVDLDENQDGIVTGDRIQYLDGSEVSTDASDGNVGVVEYTLSTPKGGVYSVVLPDGSKVWLNAASTLRYPSAFTDGKRAVELDGEGYFEVVKDESKPFLIRSKGQLIHVLGTSFNVNAYSDEEQVVTTLVDGTVAIHATAVNTGRTKPLATLKPNQQSKFADGQVHVTSDVSTHDFMAWRNGSFVFYGQSMPVVMRQIERWYDVTFENIELAEDVELWGVLSRDVMLSQILETIELNTPINFEQEERRIVIRRQSFQ